MEASNSCNRDKASKDGICQVVGQELHHQIGTVMMIIAEVPVAVQVVAERAVKPDTEITFT